MPAPRYPVLLDLDGHPCLVVGGGAVGARKARGLLDAGAVVTVLAPELAPAARELVGAGHVTWERESYGPGRAADPALAFVVAATDDPAVNRQVVTDAATAGTWANDASDPTGGPAARPAVQRRGPVTVTVDTGGASPTAARWLRDELAGALGPEHLAVVALLEEARKQARQSGIEVPESSWRAAVGSGMLELVRRGRTMEAKERLQACLSSSSD